MNMPRTLLIRFSGCALCVCQAGWSLAHEGHKALPTRGAQVDVEKGLITLSPEAHHALAVTTAEVELRPAEDHVLAYAALVIPWQNHVYASSQLAGRITKLYGRPGQIVKRGEPLAEIASPELIELQSELHRANNDLRLAEKILEQVQGLAGQQILSGKDLLEARARHRESQNALAVARLKLSGLGFTDKELQYQLDHDDAEPIRSLPILSSIAGRIIHADLNVGKVVEPNEHLFEIMDTSMVWVRIDVLERDIQRIEVGQPVELRLTAYPDQAISTSVRVKGSSLDPQTHLAAVWGQVENAEGPFPKFLPGMNGEARISVSQAKKLVTVPAAALLGDGPEPFVLVEEAANSKAYEYRKQNVALAHRNSRVAQLSAGAVFPGDRVVITGGHELATYFVPNVLRLSPEAEKNIGLKMGVVGSHSVEQVLELDATVVSPPDRRGSVSSQLAGTLQRIVVDRNQTVHAGDVIGEIASLEMQNLQLEYLRAYLEAEQLTDTLERLRPLDRDQITSRRKTWEIESAFNAAANRRDSTRRKLETIGISSEQIDAIIQSKQLVNTLPLRAPIDGVVVQFDKVLGQAVKPDEPLFEVQDLSHTWIQINLSERELSQIRLDQPARVRILSAPGFLAEGTLVRSGGMLGSENRTLALWVELKEQPVQALQPNMLARVTLSVAQPTPTLAVPIAAIVRDGTRAYAFVRKPDGIFERRAVELGRSDDRFIEIKTGLREGEAIAVAGTTSLQTAYAATR